MRTFTISLVEEPPITVKGMAAKVNENGDLIIYDHDELVWTASNGAWEICSNDTLQEALKAQ